MKMTKGDFDAFLDDDAFWPDGQCHDETVFRIDGEKVEEVAPALPDSTLIVIVDGVVADADMTPIRSLKAHARRWQAAVASGEFAVLGFVDLSLELAAVRAILYPESRPLTATIIGAGVTA
ncbi:hypothetical protein [Halomonas sp. LBP4]|uniref:hypothetical protein n=1 Tax=Halomonas sp. LBP4 TaxID=2044917 RepID=UPI000D76E218|nr:hypothetical protein [Halomonas sp. LBP4]PXX95962.1 hypothetical protein CR157_17370 [Halomonas sp. LBP4]